MNLAIVTGILLSTLLTSVTSAPISRRGWNSWDNFLGNSNEQQTLAAASYMQANLYSYGFNIVTIDEGWYWLNSSSNGVNMDAYGRPTPRIDQYPSAANGQGFTALAQQIHSMNLLLGVWTIRGIPKIAGELKLPIFNSTYTVDQALRLDRPCSWSPYCAGCADNADGTACNDAAYAYYRSVAAWYKEQNLDFVKIDCMWPGDPSENGYFDHDLVAFTTAFQEVGIEVSLSPGLFVSTQNGTFVNDNKLASFYRVTQDFWDSWNDPHGPYGYPTGLRSKLDKALEFADLFNNDFAIPDLDMLCLGMIYHEAAGPYMMTNLTHDEQKVVLTLWTAVGAPLMFGGRLPLESSDSWTLSLLTNAAILRVHNESTDRVPLIPIGQVNGSYTQYAWQSTPTTVPLPSRYISLINAEDVASTVTVTLFDQTSKYCATDLWTGTKLPMSFTGTFYANLPLHGAGSYLLQLC